MAAQERDLQAELQAAIADERAAHQEHIRFINQVLEPSRVSHLAAIAAADAQLRQVLDEHTQREKALEAVRKRLSDVRRALTPGGL